MLHTGVRRLAGGQFAPPALFQRPVRIGSRTRAECRGCEDFRIEEGGAVFQPNVDYTTCLPEKRVARTQQIRLSKRQRVPTVERRMKVIVISLKTAVERRDAIAQQLDATGLDYQVP